MSREPYLLVDCVGSAQLVLNESSGGATRFSGKFQEADANNKNKRKYTFEALDRNVKSLNETIKDRGMYGELDHPTDSIVHLANASHMITKLWWEGNVLMGEGEVLPTPAGRVLKAIIDAGGRIGISSRGVGSGVTSADGTLVIGESYKLITFDAVADPSTYEAFVSQQKRIKKETFEAIEQSKSQHYSRPTPSARVNPDALIGLFGQMLEHEVTRRRKKI